MKAYHVFSDLVYDGITREIEPGSPVHGGWTSDGKTAVIGVGIPSIGELQKELCCYGESIGLRLGKAEKVRGTTLVLDDGKVLKRHSIYALAEVNMTSPLEAVRAILDGIKEKHGEGRVWFMSTPSYLHKRHEAPDGHVATRSAGYWKSEYKDVYPALPRDQDQFISNHNGDGSRRVTMGAYYFHENS